MDFQIIIVAFIIFLAALYVGKMMLGKIKQFSTKNKNCVGDCGCDPKSDRILTQIYRD